MSAPVPSEIRIRRASRRLEVGFEDGTQISLPAEYLRVESPSAEVQGHAPEERKLVFGKSEVNITAAEPIGNYAIRILFSDGHDTGIYSWALLQQLSLEYDGRWQAYLSALVERGLSREA